MTNKLKETIDSYNKNVESYVARTEHISIKKTINLFLHHFYFYQGKKVQVLDAGCAYGRDSALFYSMGVDVSGIDLSEYLIRTAKSRYPDIPFYKMDVRKTDFKKNTFDGVFCSAVLHHLDRSDVLGALWEFNRITKSGGFLYVCVKEGSGQDKRLLGDGFVHETFFSNDEMVDNLSSSNWQLQSFYTNGSKTDKNQKTWLNYISKKA
ncbi:MAG: class I SAM-dependent methyltransferase [Nanoarchaeota archaeon]|nr:class I SAM-dependent methyltransferase [Nanoarchaeota archaeon]MBU1030774.1 class I SAM-dependent methyltransferase [Nanoarchaeota archaeon]MBU1850506.1 class I SAM-dependent methyltransferase [Nanoarchaeota archaeon]